MPQPLHDLPAMLAALDPAPDPTPWVFAPAPEGPPPPDALGWFREPEGASLIRPARPDDPLPMRRIVLRVASALDGVGLTAAVATALAAENIPCNMVAALRHDHVFIPAADADRALAILRRLQAEAEAAAATSR